MTAEVFSDLINHRISLRKFGYEMSFRATVEHGGVRVLLKMKVKEINGWPGPFTLEFTNMAGTNAIEAFTETDALSFVRRCVHHAVLHEADECIELDFAKRPFDPHASEVPRQ